MRLRRVWTGTDLRLEHLRDGGWTPLDADGPFTGGEPFGGQVFAQAWERDAAGRQARAIGGPSPTAEHPVPVLPFQPLSFRDFMLHEKHAVDAARGLVRRFHPGQYRVTRAVEALTRRPFPLFRPAPLFHRQPVYYLSNHTTFVPSGTPVAVPTYSTALDYELELGFVLARPLLDATPEEALAAIGAFVLVNDLSARDVQRREMASGFGPQKSKHFTSSMSVEAVTADEILPRVGSLTGTVRINGELVSHVSDAGMRWSLGEVLAHASRSEPLLPGELLATGTLPGGSGMETGRWLRPGDTFTLTLDGVGQVEHSVLPASRPASRDPDVTPGATPGR